MDPVVNPLLNQVIVSTGNPDTLKCAGCDKHLYNLAFQCHHVFHLECGNQAARNHQWRCPLCRARITEMISANHVPGMPKNPTNEQLTEFSRQLFPGTLVQPICVALKELYPADQRVLDLPLEASKDELVAVLRQLDPSMEHLTVNSTDQELLTPLLNLFPHHPALALVIAKNNYIIKYLIDGLNRRFPEDHDELAAFTRPSEIRAFLLNKYPDDEELSAIPEQCRARDLLVPMYKKFPEVLGVFHEEEDCAICLEPLAQNPPYIGVFINTSEQQKYHPECFQPAEMGPGVSAGAYAHSGIAVFPHAHPEPDNQMQPDRFNQILKVLFVLDIILVAAAAFALLALNIHYYNCLNAWLWVGTTVFVLAIPQILCIERELLHIF